ncbi:MAG: flagellar basal body P-ring formation chaperone FlgA [Dissulfurispiraceae bacterium]|jgi:flagella basal body P-ring formation protein FlgA
MKTTFYESLTFSLLLLALCLCFLVPSVALADRQQLTVIIKKAVLAELVRSVSENVELSGIRCLKGFEALDNGKNYTVGSISMDGYNGPNRIVYLTSLYDDEKTVYKVLVEASYDILTSIFVASRPLVNGTIITRGDVYSVKQKNSRLPSGAITDIAEIEGKTLKSNVAEGAILRSGLFSSGSGIKKGKEVIVLVEGANVLISTKGVLSADASVGGVVRVLCSAPRKEIVGILVSPDTVKVKI